MAELHEILLRPLVTEKGAAAEVEQNTYMFEVGETANKHEIKAAVERYFNVDRKSTRLNSSH